MMWTVLAVLGLCLTVPAVSMRLWMLAATRLGWIVYFANVLSEAIPKMLGWRRGWAEALSALAGIVLAGLAGVALGGAVGTTWLVAAVGAGVSILVLDIGVHVREVEILGRASTHVDHRRQHRGIAEEAGRLAGPFPSPSPHPHLVVNLGGPFVARMPRYDLGDLVVGRQVELELLIGNHSEVPCQVAPKATLSCRSELLEVSGALDALPLLAPGDVVTRLIRVNARRTGRGGRIDLEVSCGDRKERIVIHVRSVVDGIARAVALAGYPGARRAAFAWRGDVDHYDTSTFQSIDGIRTSLELGRRYRVPQTLFMSSRLTVDLDEAQRFYQYLGVERGQGEIPRFIEWLRESADLSLTACYPWSSNKPYLFELGNHGHLHYGTDAAAAPENGWTLRARMGAGRYPWQGHEEGSFAEQRDNALETSRRFEALFGFTPRSWAMPDRTNDAETARAMEAAGCEVLSDSDARTVHNVIYQPSPHHPSGTAAVELTKRYPGDPQHLYHYAMILYWVHRAHRLGIPVVFMSHQHLRQYDGPACARFTEAVLRHVLTRFHGDLYVDTVFGLGSYWKDAFSPENRVLCPSLEGRELCLGNRGRRAWRHVPVEVRYEDGGCAVYLVDAMPGQTTCVDLGTCR